MIVYDGMTSFITMPNWVLMILLELATIVIETVIFVLWWKYRNKRFGIKDIIGLSIVANIVTAAIGLYVANANSEFYYNHGGDLTSGMILVFFTMMGGVFLASWLFKKEESPVDSKKVKE
jgi:hypothetical protein